MKLDWKTCFRVGISIFALYLLITYWEKASSAVGTVVSASTPLLIGFVIAYVVNILMCFYEKWYFKNTDNKILIKTRRPLCMIAAYLTFVAIIGLIIGLIIPQLIECIGKILSVLPIYFEDAVEWIVNHEFFTEDVVETIESFDWKNEIAKLDIAGTITTGLGGLTVTVITTISTVFSFIVTTFISVIFSVYLLLSKDRLIPQFKRLLNRYLKSNTYKKIEYVGHVTNGCFKKYIAGQCIEAVILGVLCTIGMLILRMPYASMIGPLVAFTALIPVAGAFIGGGIGAFLIFVESPIKALIFLVFIVVLQQFEGNVIYPKVVGTSLGLPGMWVLAAITLGGGLMGVLGMLLGVPITATIYKLLHAKLKKERKPTGIRKFVFENDNPTDGSHKEKDEKIGGEESTVDA